MSACAQWSAPKLRVRPRFWGCPAPYAWLRATQVCRPGAQCSMLLAPHGLTADRAVAAHRRPPARAPAHSSGWHALYSGESPRRAHLQREDCFRAAHIRERGRAQEQTCTCASLLCAGRPAGRPVGRAARRQGATRERAASEGPGDGWAAQRTCPSSLLSQAVPQVGVPRHRARVGRAGARR